MKFIYPLSLLVAALTTQCAKAPKQETWLSPTVLAAAARIIPTEAGYILLEIRGTSDDPGSPNRLVLFDAQKRRVDEIPLHGGVLSTGKERITVNRSMDGRESASSIGFLAIDYVDIAHPSKGGVNFGTFLVDSTSYNHKDFTLRIFAKKPVRQFVATPSSLNFERPEFVQAVSLTIPLRNIDLQPFEANNKYFNVTTRLEKRQLDSTVVFYFQDSTVVNAFYKQLITK